MHAYALTFSLLDVQPGDHVLDLGAGYGSAILPELVGENGSGTAVELHPQLRLGFRDHLPGNVRWLVADAMTASTISDAASKCRKVAVGFALAELPAEWVEVFREGTTIVAPIGSGPQQDLVRAELRGGRFNHQSLAKVRYVRTCHTEDLPTPPREPAPNKQAKRLPVMP